MNTKKTFQAALYLGDVEERVNILKNCGQKSLAYLTAATHGLTEQADEIAENAAGDLPEPLEDAALLVPPPPVTKNNENWPLLTVSKGFFDGNIQTGKAAAAQSKVAMDEMAEDEDDDAAGWGDDDDDLDSNAGSDKDRVQQKFLNLYFDFLSLF